MNIQKTPISKFKFISETARSIQIQQEESDIEISIETYIDRARVELDLSPVVQGVDDRFVNPGETLDLFLDRSSARGARHPDNAENRTGNRLLVVDLKHRRLRR